MELYVKEFGISKMSTAKKGFMQVTRGSKRRKEPRAWNQGREGEGECGVGMGGDFILTKKDIGVMNKEREVKE